MLDFGSLTTYLIEQLRVKILCMYLLLLGDKNRKCVTDTEVESRSIESEILARLSGRNFIM